MMRYKNLSMLVRSRGIAMVEFVIVLPLCLMLMMATAEFGRAFMQYNTLTQSVRDAVKYASEKALDSCSVVCINGALRAETENLAVYGNTAGTGPVVLPGLAAGAVTIGGAGTPNISVSVTYPYSSIFTFVPGFSYAADKAMSGINMQAAATMRALGT